MIVFSLFYGIIFLMIERIVRYEKDCMDFFNIVINSWM